MEKHVAIGLMSGTSLDGLDIAACEFIHEGGRWTFQILQATTLAYPDEWHERLKNIHHADALAFWRSHVEYGHFLGEKVIEFIESTGLQPDLIASHGHTVFHQPSLGFTMQLGAGEAIAAETGFPVVSDFRSADVALGGNGAPLVPMGDRLLFARYGACLNLGGFSNVSYEMDGRRIAFDICPANIILNHLARQLGHEYDHNGAISREGKTDIGLLNRLNKLPYYSASPPKSLGREWLEECLLPLFIQEKISTVDLLRTACEHIGQQVGKALQMLNPATVMVTGGGAHNAFLVETIRRNSHHDYFVPDRTIVDYKEAMVFAFLGVLRRTGRINILSSVTGARQDHSGGSTYHLFPA